MSSQDPITASDTDPFKEFLGGKNDGLVILGKLGEGKTKIILSIRDPVGLGHESSQSYSNGSDSRQSDRVLVYSKDRITAGIYNCIF